MSQNFDESNHGGKEQNNIDDNNNTVCVVLVNNPATTDTSARPKVSNRQRFCFIRGGILLIMITVIAIDFSGLEIQKIV